MLRIIAGRFKGRKLHVPDNHRKTRPTLDRVRETIFNILTHNSDYPALEGANVLDLFAGSGSLGFEALSRGAAHVTFVDEDVNSLACCKKNTELLNAQSFVTVCKGLTQSVNPPKKPYDIVLIDPPYYKGMSEPTLMNLLHQNALAYHHILALEMAIDEHLQLPTEFEILKEITCGPGRIYFLKSSRTNNGN